MTSELCIHHVPTGETEVVLSTGEHIEAPNWHPDGWLLVNGGGRLYRVPLDAPELQPVDTGAATRLNNDHGFSPDGRTIALSDHSGGRGSCIWTMPVGGGDLTRVTSRTPSWWHAWSPDGARHAYAAAREGRTVLIHTCAADGSDERCLTPGFDHCDGPDYTPDGAWIWFNGERDGQVDLWRVRPDGTELERMTEGPEVDWFPHPSPDGMHVLWLAYPAGTEGHPGGLDVALRLMPQSGGAGETVVELHGGQGTINVPCWEPDGRAFAFMRYGA
ncbi:TolB family protein [Wenxinia saemankumensis]|uniref:WD40-like Beta Propeller Repeat n=1 Tax=Wenxinia saemankumensis TaxID=1447782 RepID=A0A1M6EW99_9RHOB|nr:PD40 domain-containing protein [Wenxinia saemankumensis]SHI89767.1 WD40-like Beta Propeller Repeat [Wenxinia saemankumensis]